MSIDRKERVEALKLDSMADHLNTLAGSKKFDSYFLGEVLEYLEPVVYEPSYQVLKAAEIFPVKTSVPEGAQVYKYYTLDGQGQAKAYSNGATDIPMVDVNMTETNQNLQSYAIGFSYTIEDLERCRFAGLESLDTARARKARMVLEQKLDDVAATGDADFGIPAGISPTNHNDVTLTTADYPAATAAQIVQNWADMITAAQTTANGSMWADRPWTIVFPSTAKGIHAQPYSDTLPEPLAAALDRSYGSMIDNVFYWAKLNAAGGNSEGTIMMFPRDPEVVEYVLPQPPMMTAPQPHALGFRVYMKARTGGLVWRHADLCHEGDWNT